MGEIELGAFRSHPRWRIIGPQIQAGLEDGRDAHVTALAGPWRAYNMHFMDLIHKLFDTLYDLFNAFSEVTHDET